jgi:transposase-like protein
MEPKNKYAVRSKITEAKFRQIVKLFCMDLTATQTAVLTHVNRNTVNRLYFAMRMRIAKYSSEFSPMCGTFEVDESYFGPKRTPGKRGRGAGNKTIVVGLFKRNGHVYTEIVPDCSAKTLQAVIRGKVDISSVIHSDGWKGYDGLIDIGYEKHFRVEHGKNEFSNKAGHHINGIESFWGYAKNRLAKFNGVSKSMFSIHLKECEFRFNQRGGNMYLFLLKMFRSDPLS